MMICPVTGWQYKDFTVIRMNIIDICMCFGFDMNNLIVMFICFWSSFLFLY